MKKFLKSKKVWSVVLLAVVLVLAMGTFVFAAEVTGSDSTLSSFIKDTLTGRLQGIAGAFVVLSAIATAILYMAGAVNPKLKEKGKDALYALIIGVIVLVLAGNIQEWIKSVIGD